MLASPHPLGGRVGEEHCRSLCARELHSCFHRGQLTGAMSHGLVCARPCPFVRTPAAACECWEGHVGVCCRPCMPSCLAHWAACLLSTSLLLDPVLLPSSSQCAVLLASGLLEFYSLTVAYRSIQASAQARGQCNSSMAGVARSSGQNSTIYMGSLGREQRVPRGRPCCCKVPVPWHVAACSWPLSGCLGDACAVQACTRVRLPIPMPPAPFLPVLPAGAGHKRDGIHPAGARPHHRR